MSVALTIDSNQAYEHFQFYWFALFFGSCGNQKTANDLKKRFMLASHVAPDGIGRVPSKPCTLDLSDEELELLAASMLSVEWQPGAERVAVEALNALRGVQR